MTVSYIFPGVLHTYTPLLNNHNTSEIALIPVSSPAVCQVFGVVVCLHTVFNLLTVVC